MIGTFTTAHPTCGDIHIPATYHPHDDMTWCWCGDHQWHGRVPTLHVRHVYDHGDKGATRLGYDVYWLGAA